MTDCLNLKVLFGQRYRIAYDESYCVERSDCRQEEEAWLQQIPCKYGHIFPWGGQKLAASVDGHRLVAYQLRRLPCCQVVQDGDFGELTVTFDLTDFSKVAKIMRPRRRRQISQQERERLLEMGAATRFRRL